MPGVTTTLMIAATHTGDSIWQFGYARWGGQGCGCKRSIIRDGIPGNEGPECTSDKTGSATLVRLKVSVRTWYFVLPSSSKEIGIGWLACRLECTSLAQQQ